MRVLIQYSIFDQDIDWESVRALIAGLQLPDNTIPSLTVAFNLLLVSIYTLTYPTTLLIATIRVLFSAASAAAFLFFAYAPSHVTSMRLVEAGIAILEVYGLLRAVETGFVYFIEPVPRWVVNGEIQPLPTTFPARVCWSIDLLLSMRGTSWFKDTHWDFCPRSLFAPEHQKSRLTFIREGVVRFLGLILIIDICDIINRTRTWAVYNDYPITSLPWHQQIMYAISVCVGTALSIDKPYTLVSVIFVTLGSDPASWPPQFNHPFTAISLSDFWTTRWHASFRRVSFVVSAAIVDLSHRLVAHRRARALAKGICIFSITCLMHLGLMHRVNPPELPTARPFWDRSTVLFFLAQPLGMFLEAVLVRPAVVRTFRSPSVRQNVTRAWAWGWLVYTGRWWSDVWVKNGCWGPTEVLLPFSPIRGILYGQWKPHLIS